jgi:hypothetical protein
MKGVSLRVIWLLCTLTLVLAQNPCNITYDLNKDINGVIISSPNYGSGNYPSNLYSCWSNVSNRPKNGIIIEIISFNLHKKENEDCFDYLEIDYGNKNIVLCGTMDPVTYIIDSNEMRFNFVSDEKFESGGFKIKVSPIQLLFFAESGVISSPKVGTISNYADNMNIAYKIQGKNDTYIYMRFGPEFAIEKYENRCVDYLQIESKSDQLKLCGYEVPTDMLITSNNINLRFFTDSSETDKGFTIAYKQIKWLYTLPTDVIMLDQDTVPITYKIMAPIDYVIEVSVENFDFNECHRISNKTLIDSASTSICLNGQNDHITVRVLILI